MSWIKPVGKRALKYGPQAQLLWKHAGRPASEAAQAAIASSAARRTALKHADTVREGAVLKAFHQGRAHWVVLSGGTPVISYPAVDDVAALIKDVDLAKKVTPEEVRARRADLSRRRRAIDAARSLREQIRHRRSGQ